MNVILLGYMGSGKSAVGKILSERMKYEFIDSDSYIQNKEELTIPQIFANKGEVYFRRKEHLYLKELLNLDQKVLALGGGTPCYGNNMQMILNSESAISIYLKASIPTLAQRLKPEKDGRPLISHLNNDADMIEFIGKHLFERSFFYSQSDHTILTDGRNPENIALEIQSLF